MLIPSCPIPQKILAGRSASSSSAQTGPVCPHLRPLLRITSCAWVSTCPPRSTGTACEVSSRGPARHGRRSGAAGKCPTRAASTCPPLGLWLVLQVRAQELVMQQQGLGGRAAGPNSLSWRPDIPSRSACEEGDSSTLLAAGQGGAAAAVSAVGKIGPTEAVRARHSLGQRRADGEPEEVPDTPLPNRGEPPALSRDPARTATAERATLGLGPQSTAVQDWQPVGSKSSADTQRRWGCLWSTRGHAG